MIRPLLVLIAIMLSGAAHSHPGSHDDDSTEPEVAKSLVLTTAPSPALAGCPEGTFASEGWPGEQPSPVIQVISPILMTAKSDPCATTAPLSCAVPPGLYHPWSKETKAEFQTVAPVGTPNLSTDFGTHQYLRVTCASGMQGWLLASDLLENEDVVTGKITEQGEVTSSTLPQRPAPVEKH